jgi:hypothetical protein
MTGKQQRYASDVTRAMARAFDQIVEDTGNYYMLRYTPVNPPASGACRKLRVRVIVTARHGYVVPKPTARSGQRPPAMEDTMPVIGSGRGPQLRVRPGVDLRNTTPGVSGVPDQLSMLLASALPVPGLPLRVQAIPFRGTDKKSKVQLVVEVLGGPIRRHQRTQRRIHLRP